MAICKSCGAKLKDGTRFCKQCGQKVEPAMESSVPESIGVCPHCGVVAQNPGSRFCKQCGRELVRKENTEAILDTEAAAAITAVPAVCCPNCGEAVPDGMKFCPSCGQQIGTAEPKVIGACAVCGTQLKDGWIFCKKCGTPVDGTAAPAAEPVEETAKLKKRKRKRRPFAPAAAQR